MSKVEVIESGNPLPDDDLKDNIASDYDEPPARVQFAESKPIDEDIFDNFGRNLPDIKSVARNEIATYTKEEQESRRKLIAKLKSAKDNFPDETKGLDVNSLDSVSTTDLADKIEEIDRSLNTGNSVNMGTFAIVKLTEMIENLTRDTGLKLKGLSQDIQKDKELMKMLKTLAWQYDSFFEMPLSVRITVHLTLIAWMRHQANEAADEHKDRYNKPVNTSTYERYKDL